MDQTAAPAGIDPGNVTTWMTGHEPSVVAPLSFELITGGLSNLTYLVTDATDRRWVLRRPPLGHVLATAHDVGREHRIITALAPTPVPVAPSIGLCTDDAVNGAPFYVMELVDGIVARDTEAGGRLAPGARQRAGAALVEVLAAIHEVDVDAVGLGDLGRREAYVERQLSRWSRQWEATRDGEVPVVDDLHARLAASVPAQGPATIVHGDYRLDNCILTAEGEIAAVLDWELCTLGDPLADVGPHARLLGRGRRRHPDGRCPPPPPSTASRAGPSSCRLYAERSGRDVSRDRLLRRPRLLEAGLHPPGRARPVPCRRDGRSRRRLRPVLRSGRRPRRRRHGAPSTESWVRPVPELYRIHEAPELIDPVLIVGLDGWIDAGYAAANAVGTMLEGAGYVTIASFDTDVLLDHRSRRPTMHIDDGITTGLTWPTIELRAATDANGGEALFLVGAEPDHLWRAFSVGRRRPRPRVRGQRGRVARRLPRRGPPHPARPGRSPPPPRPSRPTGWARSPGASTCPPGSTPPSRWPPPRAACRRSASGPRCRTTPPPCPTRRPPRPSSRRWPTTSAWSFPAGTLAADAVATRARLDELVGNNDDHQAMLRQLEVQFDADDLRGPLPSGDDLAAELEQYLRDQE